MLNVDQSTHRFLEQFKLKLKNNSKLQDAKIECQRFLLEPISVSKEPSKKLFIEHQSNSDIVHDLLIQEMLEEKLTFVINIKHNKLIPVGSLEINANGCFIPEVSLNINKDYRGLGLGKSIMTEFVDWAKKNLDHPHFYWRVESDNEASIKLIRRYQETPETAVPTTIGSTEKNIETYKVIL